MIVLYVCFKKTFGILSRAGHVKSCLNLPEPSGKAKYIKRPIVNKYCEGKVKRTVNNGVK